jgi:hypothetical protein
VSPVKYELGSYIPVDDVLHNHRRENLKSYVTNLNRNVSEEYAHFPARLPRLVQTPNDGHTDGHNASTWAYFVLGTLTAVTDTGTSFGP